MPFASLDDIRAFCRDLPGGVSAYPPAVTTQMVANFADRKSVV